MITLKELENIRDTIKTYPPKYYDDRPYTDFFSDHLKHPVYVAYTLIAYFKLSEEEVMSMTLEQGLTYFYLFSK